VHIVGFIIRMMMMMMMMNYK